MTTTIHFKPRLAQRRAQIVNDAVPGIILLFSGLETFSEFGFTPNVMPYISVMVGVAVVRSAIDEFRGHKSHRKVNWFDISGGCVILIDAATRYKPYKGFQPAHLLILAGILIILRGIFEEKLPKLRRVVLSDEHIFARTSLFHSTSCHWNDVLKIERTPTRVLFILRTGKKELNLRRTGNRTEVIDKIVETATGRGIEVCELT